MVENSWVTLTGEVDHGYQRASAESALRNLMGIKGIRNQIKIKPGVTPTNVKSSIEAALHRRVHAKAQAINVMVEGDEVTLSGSVPSLPERRAAALAASFTPGVAHVIDHMVVV